MCNYIHCTIHLYIHCTIHLYIHCKNPHFVSCCMGPITHPITHNHPPHHPPHSHTPSPTLDHTHSWPSDALVSVATRFLTDVPDLSDTTRHAAAQHMAFVHSSVVEAARQFALATERKVYVTPRSFLELISFFKTLLAKKRQVGYVGGVGVGW